MQKKVAIITGASSGIGKSCVKEFLDNGFIVVAAARSAEKLESLALEVNNSSVLLTQICDVSVEADCKNLIEETIGRFKRVDVLINNAGISMRALFIETDLTVIRELMDVNFWGTVYCTKYALPHVLQQRGSIIGVSSIAGKKGLPGRTGYSASKFAMEGFLETIRMEHMKDGLHVMIACPGFTNSEIRRSSRTASGSMQGESPRNEGKMMSSQEVAQRIFIATKNKKRDLVLSLNGKLTVLLNKFLPGYTDKLVYKHMAKEPGSPFN
ncbi:MAG: SDR family oxidoreductase [Bacteroidia bacterium]|nr:SDR family oxidoreductase [Bacteroidia bacterium]